MPAQTSSQKFPLIGALALLPALFIELVGVSFFLAPENVVAQAMARMTASPESLRLFNLVVPVVCLGGALAAFTLNLRPLLRPAQTDSRFWNLLIVALSVLVTVVLVTYAVGENWPCITGRALSC